MADLQFKSMLAGFSLTTAEILYHLPDYPALLQTFIWQDYDVHPRFPKLKGFLEFWSGNIEGALYQIRVAHAGLIKPRDFQFRGGELLLH